MFSVSLPESPLQKKVWDYLMKNIRKAKICRSVMQSL